MGVDDFRWDHPLPNPGTTTVLEASAGTGKTFTIAGLVARFVADGTPLGEILAVTFSRRATAELRDGIRDRLLASRQAVQRVLQGGDVGADHVNQVITSAEPTVLAERLTRMEAALAHLDAAPIVTLHTFAARMLDELGLLADHDRTITLGADLDVLADEVIADTYLAEARWSQLGWSCARQLGVAATRHPRELLHPTDGSAALRVEFAAQVRLEFDRRKRRRRVLDYDDMIGRLADSLNDSRTGPAAAQALSERFRVVLVDEFQDTDPQQWAFLRAGFHGRSTMMLIGDPKQAIYRFRGGDIETYSAAKRSADRIQRLVVNYRSDAAVVAGVEMLFGPVDLGSRAAPIAMTRVRAHEAEPRIRMAGRPLAEAVQVRALASSEPMAIGPARTSVQTDLLNQVEYLLAGQHELRTPGGDWRKVSPNDIVVLVNANRVGQQVHQMLTSAGHSSVFSGESSVFTTEGARDWLVLLEALSTPDRWHLRRATLTSLVGWTSADLSGADEDRLVTMTALLNRCARLLVDQGVAAVFETLVAERELYGRLLSQPEGEALVTDLRHIAEFLNEAQSDQHSTPSALTEQLRRRIERAATSPDERTRRLPTDRPAIRVMTVHAAKGLQFPIVLLPQAADRHSPDLDKDEPIIGHLDGRRVLDVAPPRERGNRAQDHLDEELAESLRSFYVACTRAQSLLICWWAPTAWNTSTSALHRLLKKNSTAGTAPDHGYLLGDISDLPRRKHVDLTIVDPSTLNTNRRPTPSERASSPHLLDVRTFHDHIDRSWARTSYTGLTAAVHAHNFATMTDEHEEMELAAELDASTASPDPHRAAGTEPGSRSSAMAPLPGGAQFGSLVHAVLEVVDPRADDLRGDLRQTLAGLADRFAVADLDHDSLVEGLHQALTTGLGALTDGLSLRDLGARHRLAELDFELPLGSAGQRGTVSDLAHLFDSMLTADDPLHSYGRQLLDSAAAGSILAGFLTGSIDAVVQVPSKVPRYVILDYKTNRVPTRADDPLTASHYHRAAMAEAMREAHYPLQALLYCAALHRYLTWRLPGYRPDVHLGGVGYLFVRGMVGESNPMIDGMPSGVFVWLPPPEMVVEASRILAGGR